MSQPLAFGNLHVGEDCRKGGILRAAGVNAKADFTRTLPHMAYSHLGKLLSVQGTFDTVVIFPSAEPIPHGFNLRRDCRGGPIRIAVVGDYAAQVLKLLIFVFYRSFEPVFTVQVHHNATLIKTVVRTSKVRLDYKGEEPFFCFQLEYRGVVIAEMVVGPLP